MKALLLIDMSFCAFLIRDRGSFPKFIVDITSDQRELAFRYPLLERRGDALQRVIDFRMIAVYMYEQRRGHYHIYCEQAPI
jgi:hypothetical protein